MEFTPDLYSILKKIKIKIFLYLIECLEKKEEMKLTESLC